MIPSKCSIIYVNCGRLCPTLCHRAAMNKEYRSLGMVLVSPFLWRAALPVIFLAGSAFQTLGTTSLREVSAACVTCNSVSCVLSILVPSQYEQRIQSKIAHLGRLHSPISGGCRLYEESHIDYGHSLAGFRLPWQRDRCNNHGENDNNTSPWCYDLPKKLSGVSIF